jgi:hypothetical protein
VGIAQVLQCLLRKLEAWSSNPNTTKNQKPSKQTNKQKKSQEKQEHEDMLSEKYKSIHVYRNIRNGSD